MKVLLPSCVIVLILIVIGGCKVFGRSVQYTMYLENIGAVNAKIYNLCLYKGARVIGGGGDIVPRVHSSNGYYTEKPNKEIEVTWGNAKTGEKFTTKVNIEPPSDFYREKYPEIMFYFDPDNGDVHVVYKISKKSNKPAIKLSDGSVYQDYDTFYLNSDGTESKFAKKQIALGKRNALEELLPLLNAGLTEDTIDKLYSCQPFFFNISDFELRTMKCKVETILEFSKKMSQNKRLREGALEYFEDMKSQTVKLYWAMLFLQNNEATAETNNYLKDALKTSKGKEQLTEWLGGESQLKTFEEKLNKL